MSCLFMQPIHYTHFVTTWQKPVTPRHRLRIAFFVNCFCCCQNIFIVYDAQTNKQVKLYIITFFIFCTEFYVARTQTKFCLSCPRPTYTAEQDSFKGFDSKAVISQSVLCSKLPHRLAQLQSNLLCKKFGNACSRTSGLSSMEIVG